MPTVPESRTFQQTPASFYNKGVWEMTTEEEEENE